MPQTICLDFDGVVHLYVSPWVSASHIPDAPVEGAFNFIEECLDSGFEVAVFSSRSHESVGREAIIQWFKDHRCKSVPFLKFPEFKPPALLYIDDRGYHFEGTFPSIEFIKTFKPWNK